MWFQIDQTKIIETAALFLRFEGGSINYMKLVKLVYLLDRLSLKQRGIPVLGGSYYSLKHGPITSEVLNLTKRCFENQSLQAEWNEYFSPPAEYVIQLLKDPGRENLSDYEIKLAEKLYQCLGGLDQYQIRDWCHEHCLEWFELNAGRKQISVRDLYRSVGKTEAEIQELVETVQEENFFRTTKR